MRKAVDHVVTIEGIQAVVKPGAVLGKRAGEFQAGCPLIDVHAAIGGDARDEVRSAKPQTVVAHLGLEVEYAGGAAAVVGGEAAGLHIHRLDRLDIDARLQAAGDGVRNIEAVELVVGLVGIAAVEVRAAGIVFDDAVHQRQGVAVVLRGGVRNRLNFRVVEFLVVRRLFRIDSGRGVGDIDSVREFLEVVERDGQFRWAKSERLRSALVQVETQPLGTDGVFTGSRQVEGEISRWIGRRHRGRATAGRAHLHSRSGDPGARIVYDPSGDANLGRQSSAQEDQSEKCRPNVRAQNHAIKPAMVPVYCQHSARWPGAGTDSYYVRACIRTSQARMFSGWLWRPAAYLRKAPRGIWVLPPVARRSARSGRRGSCAAPRGWPWCENRIGRACRARHPGNRRSAGRPGNP